MRGGPGHYQPGERGRLVESIRAGQARGFVQCPRCGAHFHPPLVVPATGTFEVFCTVCATGTRIEAAEVRGEQG